MKKMEQSKIETIKTILRNKIEVGDFITLSKVLEIKPQSARARFERNNKTAIMALNLIIKEKQALVHKIKQQISK